MSSSYRLLALDIDGTILRTDKTISPRTLAALVAARAAGVHLVLVTGRRLPAARRVAETLGQVDLVLHNGALIVEAPGAGGGEPVVVRCRPLPRESARRAIRLGREWGADPVVHLGQRGEGLLLVEGVAPSNTLLAYYLDNSHPDVRTVPDLEALPEDPLQVMFGGALTPIAAMVPHLEAGLGSSVRIERTVYPRIDVAIVDVLAPDVGKAEALRFLQARWQVRPQETLAIGDNWNDQDMLVQAGLGLVMGNADPEMHALGLGVLPSNDEDGVAVAIEQHILA